jgi:hypothetical protein
MLYRVSQISLYWTCNHITRRHCSIYNQRQQATNPRYKNCSDCCPTCSEHMSHVLNTDLLIKHCFPLTSGYKISKECFSSTPGITVQNDPPPTAKLWSHERRALVVEWRKLLSSARFVWYPRKLWLHCFVHWFNRSFAFSSAGQYFIVFYYCNVNMIFITFGDLLVRHVSTCLRHLQIITESNEVLVVFTCQMLVMWCGYWIGLISYVCVVPLGLYFIFKFVLYL